MEEPPEDPDSVHEKHHAGSGSESEEAQLRLLNAGEQLAKLGSWEWLPGPDTQLWSDNLYRLFGLEPGELAPTRELVMEQVHPSDRQRVARHVEMLRTAPDPPPIEYRILEAGHGVRYVRSTITAIEGGSEATRIVGTVEDITDRRIADREIAAHVAVATALSEWESFDESAVRLLRALGEACEFVLGVLWLPRDDELLARVTWSKPGFGVADFICSTFEVSVSRGVGLSGSAWASGQPESIFDVGEDPSYLRTDAARRIGLRAALAFPAVKAGEVLAVLEFYSSDADFTDRLNQTMTAIGSVLGEFFSRRRGELDQPVLTPRELEILQLVAHGQNTAQIAQSLSIAAGTAKTHLENIYRKLGVGDRAAAVAHALRLGLIE